MQFPAVAVYVCPTVCVVSSFRPDNQESLLSLSAKMLEYQKQLADVPYTVKVQLQTDDELSRMELN